MGKLLALLTIVVVTGLLVGCGSSDGKVVEGDNPASANAGTLPEDVKAGRAGGMQQTTNPPGTGRGASGNDPLAQGK